MYQNSPYLNKNEGHEVSLCANNLDSFTQIFFLYLSFQNQFLDFLVNMFGISLPFPVCFSGVSGAGLAWLGMVPPFLALATAIIFIKRLIVCHLMIFWYIWILVYLLREHIPF